MQVGPVASTTSYVTSRPTNNSERRRHQGRSVLNVTDAKFTVPVKRWGRVVGHKDIIQGVSVSMHSGETLAVMGPSGAGKTTFMDLMTLEGAGGRRTGVVDLNGEPITQEVFRQCCAYVPQYDQGWAFLTCRESLQFAAQFFMTGNAALKRKRVDELLTTMGLNSCADTKVGNEFLKGLSGGQRRRLSLAVAFLKDPLVVFLDEVTSGLDAASAAGIAKFLQELARSQDVIIACTIHQPSAKIFAGFDRLLLLSGGRVAYSGRVKDATAHFRSLGHVIPEQENPADFFLDSVNADFADRESVEKVLEAWATRPLEMCGTGSFKVKALPPRKSQNFFVETAVLFRRMLTLAVRDPTVYISRMIVFLLSCTFFAIVYTKSRDRTQDQIFNRVWLLLWHMGVPSSMSLAACLGQNVEFVAVRREVRAGMYRVSSYFVAQLLLQLPFLVLLSLSSIGFSGYVLANWNPEGFPVVLLAHVLLLFSFECPAQFFAVSFSNPLLGLLQVINLWFASFLFGGFLVPEADVPWPLRAFTYVSQIKWATKAAIFAELHDTTFDGAVLDQNSTLGFTCLGSTIECFGFTGDQVLATLKSSAMKHLATESELATDCGFLLGVAVVFRVAYFATAAAKCRSGQAVRALPGSDGPSSSSTAFDV
jgi:ABC-type multidrug transport system ATPase subunit